MKVARKQEWSMIRGDTLAFTVEIEGLEEDLSSMIFTCSKIGTDTIVFRKTLDDGCSKIETGKYYVRIAPQDTNFIEFGTYDMDLQIEYSENRYTIMQGTLKVLKDITR